MVRRRRRRLHRAGVPDRRLPQVHRRLHHAVAARRIPTQVGMALLLRFGDSDDPRARYLGWAPVPVSIRLSDATGTPVSVVVHNRDTTQGGQLVFQASINQPWSPEIRIEVPGDGSPSQIGLAGRFPFASLLDRGRRPRSSSGGCFPRARDDAGDGAGAQGRQRAVNRRTRPVPRHGGRVQRRRRGEIPGIPRDPRQARHRGDAFTPGVPGVAPQPLLLDFERELQAIEPRRRAALLALRTQGRAEPLRARVSSGRED